MRSCFLSAILLVGCSSEPAPPPVPPSIPEVSSIPLASSIKIRLDSPTAGDEIKLTKPIAVHGTLICTPGQEDRVKVGPVVIGIEIPMKNGQFGLAGSFSVPIARGEGASLSFDGVVKGVYLPKKTGSYRLTATYAGQVGPQPGEKDRPKPPFVALPFQVIP